MLSSEWLLTSPVADYSASTITTSSGLFLSVKTTQFVSKYKYLFLLFNLFPIRALHRKVKDIKYRQAKEKVA